MKRSIYSILFVVASLCMTANSEEQPVVRVGDSVLAVRNHLGQPTLEFPLHGQLILDYEDCVITSKDGVVISIQNRKVQKEANTEEPVAVKMAAYLLKKAKAGDVDAQYQLAYCYHAGKGVPRNPDECVRWYTLAAMQGHAASQHNLGVLYLTGDGVEKDYEQAYTWGILAAENGDDSLLKSLLPRLSEEQKVAARLRAVRIRDGVEPSPYGSPEDDSTSLAKKDIPQSSETAEN